MANESPPFHESDENTTDSHESINEVGHDANEHNERKRSRMSHNGNECDTNNQTATIKPERTTRFNFQNYRPTCQHRVCQASTSFQRYADSTNTVGELIETQTFWNTSYKDNKEAMPSYPPSMTQNSSTTESVPSTLKGFSASEMLQPEMEKISISLSESTMQCPSCHLYFPLFESDAHIASCTGQL